MRFAVHPSCIRRHKSRFSWLWRDAFLSVRVLIDDVYALTLLFMLPFPQLLPVCPVESFRANTEN